MIRVRPNGFRSGTSLLGGSKYMTDPAATAERGIQLPEKALGLLKPARYKVLFGGRGSSKSWSIATAAVLEAATKPIRWLCCREFQNSIDESVLNILSGTIERLKLGHLFDVQRTAIYGANGSEFVFAGLKNNPTRIKSYEGIDRVWVEEAQVVSKQSWDILTPTIRKPGSEIWVSFNPELELDETYQRFIVNPPADSWVVELNWQDNPWFTAELEAERQDCLKRDPVGYRTIWEGKCRRAVEGAIYGEEIEKAQDEGRVTVVPYDRQLPVHTGWDLGVLDPTVIWFAQVSPAGQIRLIDYYESTDEGLAHYAKVLERRGYHYGKHYAPHDIGVREIGSGKSRIEMAAALGIKFEVVDSISLDSGIELVRSMISRMWFDKRKTQVGLQGLAHYRKSFNARLNEFRDSPIHNFASHPADGVRTLCIGLEQPKQKQGDKNAVKRFLKRMGGGNSAGWMR